MAHIALHGRAAQLNESENEACEWVRAHETLSHLAKTRAALEWEEGRGLLAARRASVHRHLGFASFFEYVESLFGYKPRSIEEKLRVAEGLEALPLLSEDLRTGSLSWSAVRELTRVATLETESAWRELARGKSVRQIEDWVSGRKPGDTPDSPADSALRRHVLAFEVRAETLATFREALAKLRRDAGGPLEEEAALLLMARQVLGGPTDPGRASYQVAFTVCEQCGRGFQQGRGQRFEVDADVARMAACDAQYIGRVDSTGMGCHSEVGIPTAIVGAPTSDEARAPAGVSNDTSQFAPSDRAHVGALRPRVAFTAGKRHGGSEPTARARQSIPPSARRLVLHRDGARCVVPGCVHATFLDVHHLELRSEGGSHDPESLVALCAAHHRAVHRGALIVEGSVATGLVFRHAEGSLYRGAVSPRSAAAQTQAFTALRRLGFREGEVRRVLERLRTEIGLDAADAAQVVRAALRLLTPAHAASTVAR